MCTEKRLTEAECNQSRISSFFERAQNNVNSPSCSILPENQPTFILSVCLIESLCEKQKRVGEGVHCLPSLKRLGVRATRLCRSDLEANCELPPPPPLPQQQQNEVHSKVSAADDDSFIDEVPHIVWAVLLITLLFSFREDSCRRFFRRFHGEKVYASQQTLSDRSESRQSA